LNGIQITSKRRQVRDISSAAHRDKKAPESVDGYQEDRNRKPGAYFLSYDGRAVMRNDRQGNPYTVIAAKNTPIILRPGIPPEDQSKERKRRTAKAKDPVLRRLSLLIHMKEKVHEILDLQEHYSDENIRDLPETPWAELQRELDSLRKAFNKEFGPIKEVSVSLSGHFDSEGNQSEIYRYKNLSKFIKDPDAKLVWTAEIYDPLSGAVKPGAIITHKRVVAPNAPPSSARDLKEAIEICEWEKDALDFDYIASLLGKPENIKDIEEEALTKELAFENPETRALESRGDYLSGNIRQKLKIAREEAERDPRYQINAEALEKVFPSTPDHIPAELGMHWIPQDIIIDFAKEELGLDNLKLAYVPQTHKWFLEADVGSVEKAERLYGNDLINSKDILLSLLNESQISMRQKKDRYGFEIEKKAQEALVRASRQRVKQAFSDWLWSDKDRAQKIQNAFNECFNARIRRSSKGGNRPLRGASLAYQLRDHQQEVAIRNLENGNTGIFHAAGSGKTLAGSYIAYEKKRRGQADKVAIIPLNAVLQQFEQEFTDFYPRARTYMANEADLDEDGRKLTAKQKLQKRGEEIRDGDWDAIFMSQSFLDRIKTKPQVEFQILLDEYHSYVELLQQPSILSIDKAKVHLEDRLKQSKTKILQFLYGAVDQQDDNDFEEDQEEANAIDLDQEWKALLGEKEPPQNAHDPFFAGLMPPLDTDALYFEDLGIDYLIIDESQNYKNLEIETSMQIFDKAGSARAKNLSLILHYLRQQKGKQDYLTMMSATPVSNSLMEIYPLLKYLDPEGLEMAGYQCADAWMAMHRKMEEAVEMEPKGGSYRIKERFSGIKNLGVLAHMASYTGDVVPDSELDLKKPEVLRETVELERSERLQIILDWLVHRGEKIENGEVSPSVDNILNVVTDGRMATLSPDLVWDRYLQAVERGEYDGPTDYDASAEYTKLHTAADQIASLYHENKTKGPEKLFRDENGEPLANQGILQSVFSDLGVPKGDQYSVFEHMRELLIERGIPAEEIEFIHDHDKPEKKLRLQERCNRGAVAVLMGTTEKSGTGLNVQKRMAAIHHLDVPWRPDGQIQRNARGDRQGNMNKAVKIYRYLIEKSFDVYSWQVVEPKHRGISMFMNALWSMKEPERSWFVSAEDVDLAGNLADEYTRLKAAAANDDTIYEFEDVKRKLLPLQEYKEAYLHEGHRNIFALKKLHDRLAPLQRELEEKQAVQAQKKVGEGLVLNEQLYMDISEASEQLSEYLRGLRDKLRTQESNSHEGDIGSIFGIPLRMQAEITVTKKEEDKKDYKYEFRIFVGDAKEPVILTQNDIKKTRKAGEDVSNNAEPLPEGYDEGVYVPGRGLIVDPKWSEELVSGRKSWELRKKLTHIRGPVAIIAKGTGTIVGTVNVLDSLGPLNKAEMLENIEKTAETQQEIEEDMKDGYVHAWVVDNAIKFDKPVPYKHPNGAQDWVILERQFPGGIIPEPDTNLTEVFEESGSAPQEIKQQRKAIKYDRDHVLEKLIYPLVNLEGDIKALEEEIAALQEECSVLRRKLNESFAHQKEMEELRARYDEIEAELLARDREEQMLTPMQMNRGVAPG